MGSDHDHGARGANTRALTLALVLTGGFMVAEIVGGILSGSLALLSDAAHMFTDTAGLAIALAAIRIGQKAADSRRTFGYQRFEILAAAFNALLLFAVGMYILYEGYQRFFEPVEVHSLSMMGIAAVGLVVNLISARLLMSGKDKSLNIKGAYLEVWADMLGSICVIFAGAAIYLTGWTWIDPIVAVAIGLWVLPRTWTLLRETTNVLLEGVPQGLDLHALAKAMEAAPGVANVHDLHVWSLTSDQPSLSAHIVLGEGSDGDATRQVIAGLLAQKFMIEHVTIQTERTDCRAFGSHVFHDYAPTKPLVR
jgi:cobalt-zinc-cadmium efflux system protein